MKISIFTCLALLLHGGLGAPSIEPSLMKALQRGGTANVMVTMRDMRTSSILEGFKKRNFATRGDRITAMATELQELTVTSQANVIAFLEEELPRTDSGGSYRSIWISNQIFIRGASQELVEKLGDFNEIESIAKERTMEVREFVRPLAQTPATRDSRQEEIKAWNIDQIRAPAVWETEGNNGTGIVVAIIDTGVRFTHEAFRKNFRRDHGWFDHWGSLEPYDEEGHGTEVLGPIVGTDKQIGAAPGSTWIACKGCDNYECYEYVLLRCGQWTLCPTDPQDQHSNCSMAPHIVNNSWGRSIHATEENWYKPVTDAWYAAGIIPIFRAGNDGQRCRSLSSPADYDNVIAVGATNINYDLTPWSSVGPSPLTSEIKPDVVAPGEYVLSAGAGSDTDYSMVMGTGLAAPHVAGTVALMLASRPQDRPCFEKVRTALRQSCRVVPDQGVQCSEVPDHQRPNYHHGYGFINALRAVQIYKSMDASCP